MITTKNIIESSKKKFVIKGIFRLTPTLKNLEWTLGVIINCCIVAA
jgi:hypothetical protein